MKLIESPLAVEPVLRISPDFPYVSPVFRAGWDAWALERFGTKPAAFKIGRDTLVVHPALAAQLRAEWERQIAKTLQADIDQRVERMLLGMLG